MKKATNNSWHIKPLPQKHAIISISVYFSIADAVFIKNGCIPVDMDDHWFIYFEDDFLYFHRSSTGFCIYATKIDEKSNNFHLIEAWVNQDSRQYNESNLDSDYHSDIIKDIIENLILNNPREKSILA
jgi:hypothetical protein